MTRVLLVAPPAEDQLPLVKSLLSAGFDVLTASTREQAVSLLGTGVPDAAVLDADRPETDGFHLLRELRASGRTFPIVLLSSVATEAQAARAIREGASGLLIKPVTGDAILRALRDALAVETQSQMSRQAAEALVERDRQSLAGQLVMGVLHELQTPISAALVSAGLLKRRVRQDAESMEEVETIERAILACRGVAQSFASLACKQTPVRMPFDLGGVVKNVALLLRFQARRRQVRLRTRCARLPVVRGASVQIQQVLLNLVLNAIQASHVGGLIRVSAFRSAGQVVLCVSDDGGGIAPEHLPRLFEPFFTTRPDGTGLGLPISRRIVEEHGGAISVGRRRGRTCFTVRLPLEERP